MPLIYRIENAEGEGCYNNKEEISAARELAYSLSIGRHPTPYNDAGLSYFWGNLRNQRSWFFGYKDLDQLRSWMYTHEVRKALEDEGFMISIYEVQDHEFSAGDTQAIFVKNNAVLQGKLKLTEI